MLSLPRPAGLRKVVNMSEPILSIGMIVKDEIRCLEKCLKALGPLRKAVPCELVIADTGSTDGTREIAARYADIFFDLPWENDFSAARNAVLARCSGKWYLSLDADEYLDEHIDELVQFLRMPPYMDSDKNFGVITISNFRDQSLEKETASSFLAIRVARLRPGLRFVGKIHELFNREESEAVLDLSFVTLWHDGYAYESPAQARRKADRNMALLKEELAEDPDNSLRIVQCFESSRNDRERLDYIDQGLKLIRAGAPGWAQQGPNLLRDAVHLAVRIGLPQVQEWSELAFTLYPDSPLTQIDINAILCDYYKHSYQWRPLLKTSDAYWSGIQRLDRGEFPIGQFAASLLINHSQVVREHIALLQTEACYELGHYTLALQVLEKVSLKTIGPSEVGEMIRLLAKLSTKVKVDKLFCSDARTILEEDPVSREDQRRRYALRAALAALLSGLDPDVPCPYSLLKKLQDGVYAPSAAILSSESADEIRQISDSIQDWKRIPSAVLVKLLELDIPFPQALFQTITLEGIGQHAAYLVNHLDHPVEQLLALVDTLDTSDPIAVVWRFQLLCSACDWFKWKNVTLANRLHAAFCAASECYLSLVYPPSLPKSPQAAAILPPICLFAYQCIQVEQQLNAGHYHNCIQTLRTMLDGVPAMREMVQFLSDRVCRISEARHIQSGITPELITMAKQIRAILSQYPKDDPAVFVLKSSEQYQKMKFLIEDPNLDNM